MTKKMVKFTPNEVGALQGVAEGETVAEIAESWGVSRPVVYRALLRARRKLGARTPAHALALWLRMSIQTGYES